MVSAARRVRVGGFDATTPSIERHLLQFIPRQRQGPCPPQGPLGLSITATAEGDDFVLALRGEIDMASVQQFRRGIERGERDEADRIVVDLSRLSFIDSSAVHELLELRDRLTLAGGRLVLLAGPPQVQRVLDLCGLGDEVTFPV